MVLDKDAKYYPSASKYYSEYTNKNTNEQTKKHLRELKEIVNNKYSEAIDEAIKAIDVNVGYMDIACVMLTTVRELQENLDKMSLANKE